MGSRPQMFLHAPITSRAVVGPLGLGGREVHAFLAGRAQSKEGWMRVVMSDDTPPGVGAWLGVGDTRRGVPREPRCPEKRLMLPAGNHAVRLRKSGTPSAFRQPVRGVFRFRRAPR
jgi:hypothetical protein